jgi:hypothetical protein
MDYDVWQVIIPGALTLTGVTFTALVSRRKVDTDGNLGMIAILQAERTTAIAAAKDEATEKDKHKARADRAEARAKRKETLAWRYHQQLLRAGIEPDPCWPTDETAKVTA